MPMVGAALKQQIEQALTSAFEREFGKDSSADPTAHAKLASAISDIGLILVTYLQTNAQVAPGIPTAGSPAAQVTTAPGSLL